MQMPTNWTQKQKDVLQDYRDCPDPFGPSYDKLFSKLVWSERAKSWQDFLEWTEIFQGRWCFRGQRESAWGLQTSLDRAVRVTYENVEVKAPDGKSYIHSGHYHHDRREVERDLLFRFQQRAHQFNPQTPPVDDKPSWFALMQHHGAPTRLLDWTLSPYVALFFAVEEKPTEKNDEKDTGTDEENDGFSAVWAIDMDWLQSKEQDYLESKDPRYRMAYKSGSFDQTDIPLIVKIDPMQGNERMSAQQGFFLWKLYEETPYFDQILTSMMKDEVQRRPVISKLKVGKDLRIEFLDRLQCMNIHRASLFPDFDGFCKFLGTDLEIKIAKEAQQTGDPH